jgi:hypothetical protein
MWGMLVACCLFAKFLSQIPPRSPGYWKGRGFSGTSFSGLLMLSTDPQLTLDAQFDAQVPPLFPLAGPAWQISQFYMFAFSSPITHYFRKKAPPAACIPAALWAQTLLTFVLFPFSVHGIAATAHHQRVASAQDTVSDRFVAQLPSVLPCSFPLLTLYVHFRRSLFVHFAVPDTPSPRISPT